MLAVDLPKDPYPIILFILNLNCFEEL